MVTFLKMLAPLLVNLHKQASTCAAASQELAFRKTLLSNLLALPPDLTVTSTKKNHKMVKFVLVIKVVP